MPKFTSRIEAPISQDFIENTFRNLSKYASVPAIYRSDVFNIVNACWDLDVTLCNQIAYILATAQHESKMNYEAYEDFSYSKEALLGMSRDKKPLFTSDWLDKNVTFEYSSTKKKFLAREADWEKIANRMYANINGNGDEASGDGWKYRGRGYSQLTGKGNYERLGSELELEFNLADDPDAAVDENLSAKILAYSIQNGSFISANGNINSYLSMKKEDYIKARGLVNGQGDKAYEIAQIAQEYEAILQKWHPVSGAVDTVHQDFIKLDSDDNVLYAGYGSDNGRAEYFDGGGGNDWIVFSGTSFDINFGISDDLYHDGASKGVYVSLTSPPADGSRGFRSPQQPYFPESFKKNDTDRLAGQYNINFENIVGSDYSDVLVGNDGANALKGEDGNDLILGNLGSDTLTGGRGNDIFQYWNSSDSPIGRPDLITDFSPKRDKIDLAQIDADGRWFSNEAFIFKGRVSRSSDLIGGQVGYVISKGMTSIYANINLSRINGGDPRYDTSCEIQINLKGELRLTKDSFIL